MAFDRTDPTDLAELKSEVLTDPNGYGYIPENTDSGVLDIINMKRPEITVNKPRISAADIRSDVTYDAYDTLAIDEQEWIRWITGSNGVNEESVNVTADLRQQLAGDPTPTGSIWATAHRTEMNAAMSALMDVPGTRAEQLWGYGTTITRDDWFAARDS